MTVTGASSLYERDEIARYVVERIRELEDEMVFPIILDEVGAMRAGEINGLRRLAERFGLELPE